MITNDWKKSTRSGNDGACVECRTPDSGDTVEVRDTKQEGTGPVLRIDRDAWLGFVAAVRSGEFDL